MVTLAFKRISIFLSRAFLLCVCKLLSARRLAKGLLPVSRRRMRSLKEKGTRLYVAVNGI
eukprot:1518055-Amphidinium_carterae.1